MLWFELIGNDLQKFRIFLFHSSFFIALFRHLISVGARACYRTSLEFCKLLLSLDPESDPTGVLLMIDFYAIRAAQHAWFLRLYEEWEPSRNLSQLPNWCVPFQNEMCNSI